MSNFLKMDCHFRDMPLICYRASKLGEIGPEGDSPLEIIR